MKKLSAVSSGFALFFFIISTLYPGFTSAQDSKKVKTVINSADFNIETINLVSPLDTVRIRVSSSQTEAFPKFEFRIYKVKDPGQFLAMKDLKPNLGLKYLDTAVFKDYVDEVAVFERTMQTTQSVKNEKRINSFSQSVEFIPSESGVYLIKVSHGIRQAFNGFFCSNIRLITKISDNMILCRAVNAKTGGPAAGIKTTCYLGDTVRKSQVSDSNGISVFALDDSDRVFLSKTQGYYPFVIAERETEITVTGPSSWFNYTLNSYKAYIYTNQPVYKPGTKVEFKGTIRKYSAAEIENVPSVDVAVKITDAAGTRVFYKVLKTNSNGTFQGTYIPEGEPAEGNYKIKASLNDLTTFTSEFRVEDFKNPEYFVDMTFDKPQYANGDVITADLSASYYFGSPVADADVEYKVYKRPYYKPWWQYSEFRWIFEEYYSTINSKYANNQLIVKGSGKLDENGKFQILYSIEEDFKAKLYKSENTYETDYIYVIEAGVTDKSRSRISKTSTAYVTRSQYTMAVSTDKYIYRPGERTGIKVNTSDFSGKPVKAPLNVTALRREWNKDKKVYETEFVTTLTGSTREDGTGLVLFDAPTEGDYVFEVTSFDENGAKITEKTSCYVFDSKPSWWHSESSNTIELLPDKPYYNAGETSHIWVLSPVEDAEYLVTIGKHAILYYAAGKISGTETVIDLPILEAYGPNCSVEVSFIKDGILYNSQKSLVVLTPSKFTDISLSTDKPAYKPGETGTLTARVTDNTGKPLANTELCISVVDESIYAISEDLTKDIRAFFYPSSKYSVITKTNEHHTYKQSSRFKWMADVYGSGQIKEMNAGKLLSGKIVDEDGEPLRGAYVIIDNNFVAAVTNDYGGFIIALPEGKHELSISKSNITVKGNVVIDFTGSRNMFLNLKIEDDVLISEFETVSKEKSDRLKSEMRQSKTGSLEGLVYDNKDNSPLFGGIVSIEGTTLKAGTDEKGHFRILNIPAGTYTVRCTYVGYGPVKLKDVQITSNLTTTANFGLTTGGIMLDTLVIETQRRTVPTNTSGKLISEEKIIEGLITNKPGENISYVEAELRKDFSDAIYWSPTVMTDENGYAKIDFKLPDNLTTWRITARAITSDTRVGQNTGKTISRKDLIVRLETPRFLQQKDEVTISAIVHNYLDEDKQTKVSLSTDNLIALPGADSVQTVIVKNNEIKRFDWTFKVAEPNVVSTITATALTNQESDAMQNKLKSYPYGLPVKNSESLFMDGAHETSSMYFDIPEDASPQSASVVLNISPSSAASVLSSLDELIDYPYGCIEQTMSRFVPAVLVTRIMDKLNAPADEYLRTELPKVMDKSMERIKTMQNYDGSWGWWKDSRPDIYMTSYVLYALSLAEIDSVKFPQYMKMMKKGSSFLRTALAKKDIEATTRAFGMLALSRSDTAGSKFYASQFKLIGSSELNNLAYALLSLTASEIGDKKTAALYIEKLLKNFERDGSSKIYWSGKINKYRWQDDAVITTAMVIKALMASSQTGYQSYAEKGANWLMSQKGAHGWKNTLQGAFIAYGLAEYLSSDGRLYPDYKTAIYVNGIKLQDVSITHDNIFKKPVSIEISSAYLRTGNNEIRIEKSGEGKLYANASMIYYSPSGSKKPDESSFEITRSYYKLESYRDIKLNKTIIRKTPFTGTVKPGDEILVRISVTPHKNDVQYFMLEDPLPAGCEVIKDDAGYTIEGDETYNGRSSYSWNWWYNSKEVQKTKVSFFSTWLQDKDNDFSYIMRAAVPGKYYANPSVGSLMYYPEITGSGTENKITVLDK